MPTQSHHPSQSLSRRIFLKMATASALITPCIGSFAAAIQDNELRNRAKTFLDTALAIDMHSHVGGTSSQRPVNDFPDLIPSGLSAVCLSLVSDNPILGRSAGRIAMLRQPLPDELYRYTLERLDFADRIINENRFKRIDTITDLHTSKANKSVGIILATEGGDFLDGRLERLNILHQRGIRHFQLVHYRTRNGIGDIQTEQPEEHGATAFGLDVVRACNRLGIVVDVAHATFETVKQVAKVTSMPLVLSHTAYATTPQALSRRIDAEHAKLIKETGGVVGLWASAGDFPDFVAFAEGMVKMADVIGVDHVGIGTDMNGLLRPMLKSYLDFPSLIAPLFKYFKDDEVRKILGGNYLRVFGQVTAENKN
jgi:membrane dipeptidase